IVRAMRLDPAERFPSVRDLGAALLPLASAAAQVVWRETFQGIPQTPFTVGRTLPMSDLGPDVGVAASTGETGPHNTAVLPDSGAPLAGRGRGVGDGRSGAGPPLLPRDGPPPPGARRTPPALADPTLGSTAGELDRARQRQQQGRRWRVPALVAGGAAAAGA